MLWVKVVTKTDREERPTHHALEADAAATVVNPTFFPKTQNKTGHSIARRFSSFVGKRSGLTVTVTINLIILTVMMSPFLPQ